MSKDGVADRWKEGETAWMQVREKYPAGSRVRGRVVSVLASGYLIQLEEGAEGLIAFSDLTKVVNPSKILEVGDEVEAIVSELDMDQHRLSLSLRQINP